MPKQNIAQVRRRINRQGKPVGGGDVEMEKLIPKVEEDEEENLFNSQAKLYVPNGDMDLEWQPSFSSVFKIMFSFRMAAALWSSISDCDEVYNYWEPLHLFLYGKGFQTWEYSPKYAIRSYLYVLLHHGPAFLLRTVFTSQNKIGVFITLRCVIGIFTVLSELAFYKAICKRFGNGVGRLYIVLTVFSAGMFSCSCAFLPSSFSMALNTFALAAYMNQQWFLSILCTAISALVGWPFAAILGLPVITHMLVVAPRRLWFLFITYSLWAGTAVICALFFVDSYYYGKYVLAPLNIVLYNIFSSHGPNLYGVEKPSFYFYNLLLNWNIAVLLAIFAVPFAACVFVRMRHSQQHVRFNFELSVKYWHPFLPLFFIFLSLTVWLAIFFSQPHKEERFLFPVYPLIAILAAVTLDAIPRLGVMLLGGSSRRFWYSILVLALAGFTMLSLSRSIALYRNYSAPMKIYKGLNEHLSDPSSLDDILQSRQNKSSIVKVCVGKEWYRFPSSFFLPSHITDREGGSWTTELHFIKSEFSGLLPKYYPSGSLPDITRLIPTEMNDLNIEEPSRYIPIEECDYLVDLETSETAALEPNYAEKEDRWVSVLRSPFLISSSSDPLYRAFYIPFTVDSKLSFGTYHLLKRIR